MSTMPATHGHSEACCNTPPVVSEGYKPKGTYETLGGKKTYVTGPDSATKAIVEVFDIFGYKDQTVQGADILGSGGYRVFVPDWFDGEPCPLEYFPPNTPEKQAKLGAFFQKNPPGGVAAALPSFVKALKEKFPAIASYGVIGFCWGGKVVSLVTSGAENPFVVGAEAHPAMVEPKDALGIKVPLILLASKDEPPADVAKFEANLSAPKHVETFGDQIHGWMGARANLADEHVKAEYARGYKTVLEFFAKHL